MFQRLSQSAQRVLFYAQGHALQAGAKSCGTEHLLFSLLKFHDGVASCALRLLYGLREAAVWEALHPVENPGVNIGPLPISVNLKRALKESLDEALHFQSPNIDTEHLLLALLNHPQSVACQILKAQKVNIIGLRSSVIDLIVPLVRGDHTNRAVLQAYSALSDSVKTLLAHAQKQALQTGHETLRSEHLLLSLAMLNEGRVRTLFMENKVSHKELVKQCRWALTSKSHYFDPAEILPMTPTAKKVMVSALEEAASLGDEEVQPPHILLGLLSVPEGKAQTILQCYGLTLGQVRRSLIQSFETPVILTRLEELDLTVAESEPRNIALYAYCLPVAKEAQRTRKARLEREELDDSLTRLLVRKEPGVVILRGPSGSGKTSLIERLSLELAAAESNSSGLRAVWTMKANIAASLHPRQWRARLKKIVQDAQQNLGLVLVIDDPDLIEQFFNPQSSGLFSSAVMPAVQKGKLKILLVTSSHQQNQWICQSALGSIAQSLYVPSATKEETLEIVRAQQSYWFAKYQVTLTEDMIQLFVKESDKKRPDLAQPGNVIQLIENAAIHEQSEDLTPSPLGRDALQRALQRLGAWTPQNPGSWSSIPVYEQREAQLLFSRTPRAVKAKTVFVIRDDNKAFEHVYELALKPIFQELKLEIMESPDVFDKTSRYNDYWDKMREADLLLADVSKHNPGTLYLLGLCHGLGRSPLLIVEAENQLPEALKPLRYLEYGVKEQRLERFRGQLRHELLLRMDAAKAHRTDSI